MSQIYGFEREPYSRRLETAIIRVGEGERGPFAVLEDTLLYPAGGGQPSDRGWLNQVAILEVEKSSGELLHWLEQPVEAGPGSVVLDWPRRFDHMQQHTAQHVLTRTALDKFGWATRSFHIGAATSDIELDCLPPTAAEIAALEDSVADHILAARPVRTYRVSRGEYSRLEVRSRGLPANHEGDIRLVEIRGLDLNTCGGTHLRSTAEIEGFKVVSSEPLRGGCRLHWLAGRRVRERLTLLEQRSADLRKLLDTGDDEVLAAVQSKMSQLADERRLCRDLEDRITEFMVERLVAQPGPLVDVHLRPSEANLLRPVAERYVTLAQRGVAFLTVETASGCLFVLAASPGASLDLTTVGREVAAVLGGRGGGSGLVFQGKADALDDRERALSIVRAALD